MRARVYVLDDLNAVQSAIKKAQGRFVSSERLLDAWRAREKELRQELDEVDGRREPVPHYAR